MRLITPVLLFFLFALLTYIESDTREFTNVSSNSKEVYHEGILKEELKNVTISSDYKILVDFKPAKNSIDVKQEIVWINTTNHPTNEIQLHLYQNAYSNSKTLFRTNKVFPEESVTRFNISRVIVDNYETQLQIIHPDIKNKYDSTSARIVLERVINSGDSVKIQIDYSQKIPLAKGRSGYSADKTLFFFAQWFPKIGVYKNGQWICNQFHPFTEFFSDFSRYEVAISAPKEYMIASTGVKESSSETDQGEETHTFIQYGVHDFAWGALKDIIYREDVYRRKDGTEITIHGYIQENNEKFVTRNFNAVKNSLRFFEEKIALYPYETITFVDVTKNSGTIASMEYPTLFTFKTNEFSPIDKHSPEEVIIHEFSHQYFYGIVANNEVAEAWLDEGLANYFTSKILDEYYPQKYSYFDFFGYYPIKGILFLEIAEIPLVYTLKSFVIPSVATSFANYYNGTSYGSLADTSFKLMNRIVYNYLSYSKAEIMLQTLENYIGYERMMEVMRQYYEKYRFKHPTANDFWRTVNEHTGQDINWMYETIYLGSSYSDYKILSINNTEVGCEVWIQRNGEIEVPQIIALYTDKDTLFTQWDGEDRVKKIEFVSENIVIGAEIDPERKNLFDLNFANNSYLHELQIKGSLSIALKWFFWMQNLLMIAGGLS